MDIEVSETGGPVQFISEKFRVKLDRVCQIAHIALCMLELQNGGSACE